MTDDRQNNERVGPAFEPRSDIIHLRFPRAPALGTGSSGHFPVSWFCFVLFCFEKHILKYHVMATGSFENPQTFPFPVPPSPRPAFFFSGLAHRQTHAGSQHLRFRNDVFFHVYSTLTISSLAPATCRELRFTGTTAPQGPECKPGGVRTPARRLDERGQSAADERNHPSGRLFRRVAC
jgi:hypothetical protein